MTSSFGTQGAAPAMEQKARELGRMIGQSSEYQALKRANENLSADRDAATLLNRMTELRMQAQTLMERGEQPTAEMEHELDELLTKVQVLSTYQRAVTSQENFDKTMVLVNNWIADGIKAGATSSIITLG
ncbi:MAG: YlbF family regulator [Gemmatimonadaceae bacterium]